MFEEPLDCVLGSTVLYFGLYCILLRSTVFRVAIAVVDMRKLYSESTETPDERAP